MARKKAPPRILWALDPFEKEGETRAHVVSALQKLTEKRKAIIEPTYVLSPAEFDLALEFSPPWLKEYKPTTEKILTQALKDIILPGLISPHVLVEKKPSLRQSIRSLLSYGK